MRSLGVLITLVRHMLVPLGSNLSPLDSQGPTPLPHLFSILQLFVSPPPLPLATWHRSRDARLQKLYGYDTGSQFHDVSNVKAVIKQWEAAQSMNKLAFNNKTTPMEELGINFS